MKYMTQLAAAALFGAPLALGAQQPVARPVAARAAAPVEESQATLLKDAKISEANARSAALKEVPRGVVKAHELEREDGKLIWSYDIKVAGKSGIEEVAIDAITGAMIAHEHETPAAERKEAAADAAKAKAAGVKKP